MRKTTSLIIILSTIEIFLSGCVTPSGPKSMDEIIGRNYSKPKPKSLYVKYGNELESIVLSIRRTYSYTQLEFLNPGFPI